MKPKLIIVAALSFVGCTITEEKFPERYGEVTCDRYEECDKADFERVYGDTRDDTEDCIDDAAALMETTLDALDLLGRSYDEDAATECIKELRQADCSDVLKENFDCEITQ